MFRGIQYLSIDMGFNRIKGQFLVFGISGGVPYAMVNTRRLPETQFMANQPNRFAEADHSSPLLTEG